MDFKYISMLRSENDATNLPQVRGSGEEHFRYFVENRLNYCDSKWYASDYANDYISLRIYTPTTWAGVTPNPAITVTPFSDMYAGVRYKANGTLYQERTEHGVPVTFTPQGETFESENNESFNDTETAVYGAHQLSSIGDLAPLYCGSVNVSNADKLIELKVGDGTTGYSNANLRELSVGTNKLLKKIDIQNCPNFTSVLDLSNCPSMEEVYAKGSSVAGVNFPEAGILKIAQLPATVTNITLKHQLNIEELSLEGYDNVKTLWIENCPTVDDSGLLASCVNVERVRLTDVDWTYDTSAEMLALAAKNLKGIDENGTNIDTMWIDGKCHIKTLTGADYLAIKEAFPYMTITYDALTAELVFMSEDGTTELARQTIQNGGNGNYTGTTPTKTSTAQYHFTHSGWSLTPGGSANADALKAVEADRVVYAAFAATLRTYTVKFYNYDGTLLQTVSNVPYGSSATYTGSTPTNNSTGDTSDFEFYGWSPAPTNIQGDTSCYAQYHDMREITDSWATIAANVANGTAESLYGVGAFKTLEIGAIELPYEFYNGSSVILNGEIHILGSNNSSKAHYKWDGTEWTSISTLPYNFYIGSAVVLNDEIHILGSGDNSYNTAHYKYDGSTWTSVSTLPYKFNTGSAVLYNDEIHILGSDYWDGNVGVNHYKWNSTDGWSSVSTLPYDFDTGSAVVLNDEIHILGGESNRKYHYKYDGSTWTSVSTLPYNFYRGSAVVLNDEIHVMGSYNSSSYTAHYKWNPIDGWTSVSTLPYNFRQCSAVVYNDEIHILGSYDSSYRKSFYHYSTETATWSKYLTESIPMQIVAHNHDELASGVKWESSGTLPYNFYYGSAVVYNDEIHCLGSTSYKKYHYKWDGTSWTEVSTLPYNFYQGSAVVLNDEIHVMGSYDSSYRTAHYKWDGTSWTEVSTLPYNFYQGSAVIYNDAIHILGSFDSSYRTAHYKWDGTSWTEVSTLPYDYFFYGSVTIYNDELHILGGSGKPTAHYKWDGTSWTEVSTLPYDFYNGSALVYNDEIHILGTEQSGLYKSHYKWDGTSWTEVSTLPYRFYQGCAVVLNDEIYIMGSYSSSSEQKYFFHLAGPTWESVSVLRGSGYTIGGSFNGTSTSIVRDGVTYIIYDGIVFSYDSSTDTVTAIYTGTYKSILRRLVVYDGDIYGWAHRPASDSEYYCKLYRFDWDTVEWVEYCTLPHHAVNSAMVEYNGSLHLIGGTTVGTSSHYIWNGAEWILSDIAIPTDSGYAIACVINNLLYVFWSSGNVYATFDGNTWSDLKNCPERTVTYEAKVIPGNGYCYVRIGNKLYKFDGSEFTHIATPDEYGSANYDSGYIIDAKLHLVRNNGLRWILTNPKATLTFVAKNLLSESRQLNSTAINTGGWTETSLRAYLNGDFVTTLPSDLQTALSEARKISDTGHPDWALTTTNDVVWLLSASELGISGVQYIVDGQGEAYGVFTDNESRKKTSIDGSVNRYFTRTTSTWYDELCNVGVNYIGAHDFAVYANQDDQGILIGFCI